MAKKKNRKLFQTTVAAVILKVDELLFEGFLVHQISFQGQKEYSKNLLKYDHTVQSCKKRSIGEFPHSCENKKLRIFLYIFLIIYRLKICRNTNVL